MIKKFITLWMADNICFPLYAYSKLENENVYCH